MSGQAALLNECWGKWIIEELVRCGVHIFCISPGSRSTPLTAAACRHSIAQTKLFTDERASAYFALGYSKATQSPSVLICTSGTASANYLPAIAEASVEYIPLIIITADRPPELQQTGANQTIDQNRLFGSHVRWFFDPGSPTFDFPFNALLSNVDHAVLTSKHPLPGPVHLNLPFREPFLAEPSSNRIEPCNEYEDQAWLENQRPWIDQVKPILEPDESNLDEIIQELPKQGILSIGRVPSASHDSIMRLANKLQWPVFADIASGLRLGNSIPDRVAFYDQILFDPKFIFNHLPQSVLHLGYPPTSKRWLSSWESLSAERLIWVHEYPVRMDPVHRFRKKIEADISKFCDRLSERLTQSAITEWTKLWQQRSCMVEERMEAFLSENPDLKEMAIVNQLTKIIPDFHAFFLGNSLPIREVDFFGSSKGPSVPIGVNRGASGIDGLIASACGFAHGIKKPVSLLIGDLSLLHDLNSLQLAAENSEPVVIIVLNNQGGGIFSFLPISKHKDVFESHFATPHSLQFEQAASMFGLPYYRPQTMNDFKNCYLEAVSLSGSSLIEISTKRQENLDLQQRWRNSLLSMD